MNFLVSKSGQKQGLKRCGRALFSPLSRDGNGTKNAIFVKLKYYESINYEIKNC